MALKEKLIQELTPSEKWFFLRTAKEHILRGYPATENLFYYCYFLTLERRLRELSLISGNGLMRYLMAHTTADLKCSINRYREAIEKERLKEDQDLPVK